MQTDDDTDDEVEDDVFTCWCGARGCYEELFNEVFLDESCGGSGYLQCYCGGDQCVCHHHGEAPCPGCEDCEGDDDAYDDDWSDDGP